VKQIFQTLRELARNGMTIFLVEQNAHHALKLSDRGYGQRANQAERQR
jgi:branched-chain amino acid transport system ATP-binding protein